jgi:hypothetical protein
MHETRGGMERNGEAAPSGSGAERQRDVRLPGSAVAQSNDVVAGDDIFAARQFQRQRLIQRRNGREVERVEALNHRKAGGPNATLDHASLAIDQFEFDEAQEKAHMVEILTPQMI